MKRFMALAMTAAAAPASAHGGHEHAAGLVRLRARASGGRRALDRGAWLYAAGWLTLAGALVTPLHEAGERSFTMHMIEHELLMLVALSTSPWYRAYAEMGLTPEGLTPAQDQQLAGLIMWVPGGLFHLAVALVFLTRWLSGKEPRNALAVD